MRVILGALLLASASGCGLFGDDGDPQAVADRLAEAIGAKSLTDVSFTDAEPGAEFTRVVEGLGESKVEVAASVGDVDDNSTTDEKAVAVFVETGQSGSGTAGPLLGKMLR